MKKSNLESVIEQAASSFALQIVTAVRSATLQELIALQGKNLAAKPARKKPGPKPGRKKPGPKPGRKKPGPKPGKKKVAAKPATKAKAKAKVKVKAKANKKAPAVKKRVVRNYPKCAYPGCGNNRFVRGKGFCGEHWRMWKAGKIKAADKYK